MSLIYYVKVNISRQFIKDIKKKIINKNYK